MAEGGDDAVVLSFDDGPSDVLPSILDALDAAGAQALFFWQGARCDAARAAPARRLLRAGHALGGHGMTHRMLTELGRTEQHEEIAGGIRCVERLTGRPVRLFRPPYGRFDRHTRDIVRELGLTMVHWRVAAWDWKFDDPAVLVANVAAHARPGHIVLLHELPQTAAALPAMIAALRGAGLRIGLPAPLRRE